VDGFHHASSNDRSGSLAIASLAASDALAVPRVRSDDERSAGGVEVVARAFASSTARARVVVETVVLFRDDDATARRRWNVGGTREASPAAADHARARAAACG
jgi:hypothetical protein